MNVKRLTEEEKRNKVGETIYMNCGMQAVITYLNNKVDIGIRFKDGTEINHVKYNDFIRGQINNPNIKRANFQDRKGETRLMKCKMRATIIEYFGTNDITVRFEDGTIVYHKTYCSFKNGSIRNPNYHLGETKKMTCGMNATIIRYGSSYDIDIEFEDGTIVRNKVYSAFKKGNIKNPNV